MTERSSSPGPAFFGDVGDHRHDVEAGHLMGKVGNIEVDPRSPVKSWVSCRRGGASQSAHRVAANRTLRTTMTTFGARARIGWGRALPRCYQRRTRDDDGHVERVIVERTGIHERRIGGIVRACRESGGRLAIERAGSPSTRSTS